ncbi:MAG: C10 family peptidase [Candidatus Marinimicrobia bacterium]|nr:C10 family peptidase [Candidatus Neomarinimicrobiota bacterium]
MLNRILLLLTIISALFSAPINQSNAEQVARNLFIERSNDSQLDIRSIETISEDDLELYHIFHLSPIGFIIVAADDRVVPILGYSFENVYQTDGQPISINYFMNKFKSDIMDAIENNFPQIESVQRKWSKYQSANIDRLRDRSVSPLLSARFDQGATWNTMCPTDGAGPDGHALVGCVSVSMSQIMHYWKYPEFGAGSNSYYHSDYGNISANFNTQYDFDSMENNVGNTASQKLLYHAGVAVDMGYGADGSGAWVVGGNPSAYYALKNNFLYRTDMSYIYPYQYSDSQYRQKLKDELDSNRPMIYRGYSSDGGHAWNVDGYQDDEFHCNWGWGGSNNGYFPLSTLGGFDSDQAAVIKIQPQSLSAPNVVLNSFSTSETTGDGDGVVNPGEVVDLIIEIENMIPWLDANGIDLVLESTSEDVTVLNEFVHVNFLASGNAQSNSSNPFNIQISDDAQLGTHSLTLSVIAESNGNDTFADSYTVDVNVSLNQAGFPFDNSQAIESSPLAIDIDGDGAKELFFGDYGGFIHGIDSQGNNLPGFPVELEGTSSKQIWGSIAADDIDGDGEIELVVSCKNKHLYVINLYGNIEMDFDADQFLMGTPALADVDGDGLNEIIVAGYTSSGDVFAVNHDGSLVDGFPAQINEKVLRGVATVDLDGNGRADIVVGTESDDLILVIFDDGSYDILFDGNEKFKSPPSIATLNGENVIFSGSDDGHLYGVNIDGELRFDIVTGDKIRTSPAFAKLPSGIAIVVGSYDGYLYAVDTNGNALPGWPVNTSSSVIIDPVVTDIDGDNQPDIITGNSLGQLVAYHLDGSIVDGFPIQSGFGFSGGILSADIDNDGDIELSMGTNTILSTFDIKVASQSIEGWEMHRGNVLRNGFYATQSASAGDMNQDEILNILDIVLLVNAIMSDEPTTEQLATGDINNDNILNVLDIVQLVNIILAQG